MDRVNFIRKFLGHIKESNYEAKIREEFERERERKIISRNDNFKAKIDEDKIKQKEEKKRRSLFKFYVR